MQVIYLSLGQFCMLFLSSADFFKINFFEKFFHEYHQSVKQFGSRSGPTFVGPDLVTNCLQKLSADGTSRQKGWPHFVSYKPHKMVWREYDLRIISASFSFFLFGFPAASTCRSSRNATLNYK